MRSLDSVVILFKFGTPVYPHKTLCKPREDTSKCTFLCKAAVGSRKVASLHLLVLHVNHMIHSVTSSGDVKASGCVIML